MVTWLSLVLIGVHLADTYLLSRDLRYEVLLTFSFLPARYLPDAVALYYQLPGGEAAKAWTFLTYAFPAWGLGHLFVSST